MEKDTIMAQPQYHLEGIVRNRTETMEDFQGPLDVIFELLSKNKIEIQDVSITAILEQYLAYLEEMKRLDMEIASEFITMASHLMLIKTKMLLSAAEQAEAEICRPNPFHTRSAFTGSVTTVRATSPNRGAGSSSLSSPSGKCSGWRKAQANLGSTSKSRSGKASSTNSSTLN